MPIYFINMLADHLVIFHQLASNINLSNSPTKWISPSLTTASPMGRKKGFKKDS